MVKNSIKLWGTLLLLTGIVACTNDDMDAPNGVKGQKMAMKIQVSSSGSRTVYDAPNARANWSVNDSIGVTSTLDGDFCDARLQRFDANNASEVASAVFSGELTNGGAGTYKLYAIYPYRPQVPANDVTFSLPNFQNPTATSWDPTCDIMLGQSATQSGKSSVSEATGAITFSHMMGWAGLSFSGFDGANEEVHFVRISASSPIAGDITANLTAQTIDTSGATEKYILANVYDQHVQLKDIKTHITMFPGTYANVEIAVKTSGHYIVCQRTNLTITAGQVNNITLNKSGSDLDDTDMSSVIGPQPVMTSKTDVSNGKLNVLLLGHSFGIDCTQYVPSLLQAAGVTNANVCRFYTGDCQLAWYYNYVATNTSPQNFGQSAFVNNAWVWQDNGGITVNSKLKETPWDVVVLQQSTAGLQNVFTGCADYSTFQPWLNILLDYISYTIQETHHKKPHICYNMITSYRANHAAMYDDIVTATRQMMAETGISHILTPATAMETARTIYTDPVYAYITRDNWHASLGIGRYLDACTWFEQLFVPIYSSAQSDITVLGNTFIPSPALGTTMSFAEDEVTPEVAATLQNIAVQTAANPFPTISTP